LPKAFLFAVVIATDANEAGRDRFSGLVRAIECGWPKKRKKIEAREKFHWRTRFVFVACA